MCLQVLEVMLCFYACIMFFTRYLMFKFYFCIYWDLMIHILVNLLFNSYTWILRSLNEPVLEEGAFSAARGQSFVSLKQIPICSALDLSDPTLNSTGQFPSHTITLTLSNSTCRTPSLVSCRFLYQELSVSRAFLCFLHTTCSVQHLFKGSRLRTWGTQCTWQI